MGLVSSALEWWEEWQLRILVLSSLFVQFFLFFSIWVRRVPALRRLRVVVWMAYIGGDALAIYALGTLFNRHNQRTTDVGESTSDLEVIWAPVLLIHLGGHETLSAFSLEDNELWLRHVITLVSQVTVALYVFCKWWSGELRLLLAAVMLFFFGILKLSLKPWALRRASYSQMLASTDVSLARGEKCCSFACWTRCTSSTRGTKNKKEGDGAKGECTLTLPQYVDKASVMMCAAKKATMSCDEEAAEHMVNKAVTSCDEEAGEHTVKKAVTSGNQEADPPAPMATSHTDYFVDLSVSYSGRLSDLQYVQNLPTTPDKKNKNASYKMLQKCFEDTFDLLYTRVGFTHIETLLVSLLPFLALASVVLFATSQKHGYNSKDVKVTYILFSCTTMLEFLLPLCGIVLPCIPCLNFLIEYLDGWHDMVSQYNLMSFYVRKKKPSFLMKLAFFEYLRKYVSKFWYIRQVPAACQITKLVQQHIEDGWKTSISDVATYRRFSDLRGQLTLKKHQQQPVHGQKEMWDSLKVAFDKSVLLWHIATNLCFHHPKAKAPLTHSGLSMEMSDYMLYLLFIRAEMFLPGTRPGLFTVAIYDLDDILKNNKAKLENEQIIAREIIHHTTKGANEEIIAQEITHPTPNDNLIHEACRLVLSLMELHEKERWQIIQGVWVEMLCYSASRCRGYLHAKSLGEGGEYLSYVWLLWSYMGMETLADKIQKTESPEEIEIVVAVGELASPSPGSSPL